MRYPGVNHLVPAVKVTGIKFKFTYSCRDMQHIILICTAKIMNSMDAISVKNNLSLFTFTMLWATPVATRPDGLKSKPDQKLFKKINQSPAFVNKNP